MAVRITHITNVDDLLNALIAKGEDHVDFLDERLPYWADLWHSSLALGRYLVTANVVRPGMTTTEIGCGLGLPGIVAGLLGAEVTLTDYLPETLEFLSLNWNQNIAQPLRSQLLDWREPDPTLRAELLLASDVAYEKRSFEYLFQTLKILSQPGGRIIITEPNREIAKSFIEALAADSNYQLQQFQEKIYWNDFYKPVNILDIVRIA